MPVTHVTMATAGDLTVDILKAGLVPNLVSSPGLGKSSLAHQIAKRWRLKVIDVRLSSADPTDMNGFPMILKRTVDRQAGFEEIARAGYVPMDTFPLEGDKIPEGYKGWLLLLDEFPSAPQGVQAAAYKLVLDKMVGLWHLHKKVMILAAGNRADDKAITFPLSTALQSRVIHLSIKVCANAFDAYASKAGFDHRVRSFVRFRPKLLHSFDPDHNDLTFACPRTWEFTSKLVKPYELSIPQEKLPLFTGTVGDGAGKEFFGYCKVFKKIPKIQDILANPSGVSLDNSDPSVHYALTGLVAENMTPSNSDKLITFIERLAIDFQAITLRSSIAKNIAIKKAPAVRQWIMEHKKELK